MTTKKKFNGNRYQKPDGRRSNTRIHFHGIEKYEKKERKMYIIKSGRLILEEVEIEQEFLQNYINPFIPHDNKLLSWMYTIVPNISSCA